MLGNFGVQERSWKLTRFLTMCISANIQESSKSPKSEWSCTYSGGENLDFTIAWTKVHQNFLASKYDIKQYSDAT